MIIELIETIEVLDRWFLQQQQYSFIGMRPLDTGKVFVVEIDSIEYEIPEESAALLMKDFPSTDMRGAMERARDYINRDPIPLIYPNKDVVQAAKDFLNIDISAKPGSDQCDYDGVTMDALGEQVRSVESNSITVPFNNPSEEEKKEQEIIPDFQPNKFNLAVE